MAAPKMGSIYRRVSVRIHADERVRKLSRPQPCGLVLWHEIIFGEQTGLIPGLFRIGETGFAEQLGWPLKGFREAWREVADQGLAEADWGVRLVYVPKALRHNFPASPNVITGWRNTWELLPECELKEKAKASFKGSFKAFAEASGKASAKAFAEAFEKVCDVSEKGFVEAIVESGSVSSKQEDLDHGDSSRGGVRGGEPTACESVDNSDLAGLSDSDKAQIQSLLARGKAAEATAFLASLRAAKEQRKRSELQDNTRPTEAMP